MRIEDHTDNMLDRALELTFPASDPISVYIPEIDIAKDAVAECEKALAPLPFAA